MSEEEKETMKNAIRRGMISAIGYGFDTSAEIIEAEVRKCVVERCKTEDSKLEAAFRFLFFRIFGP